MNALHAAPPPAYADLCVRLGSALAAYSSGGHAMSLALAGALLDTIPPEAVPSIVDAATSAAGWAAPTPDHYRRNACDTVDRWSRGYPVRSDVPPAVRAVLAPAAPSTDTLDESTRRLRRTIADAPDGVTVIRAGCGLGKTRAAEDVAAERAARSGSSKLNTRTIISVPTNALAIQIQEHLRARGVPTLRLFGPASVPGPHDGWECRCRASASALAAGGLSIRWELCEGRRTEPCPHRADCGAVDGADGPDDARVVVGNHGLLRELADRAGATGLLVVDEPPNVLDDVVLTTDDLDLAARLLPRFVWSYSCRIAPALDCVRRWLPSARLSEAVHLTVALGDVDAGLLADAGADTAAEAVELIEERVPPIARADVYVARDNHAYAGELGRAARVLGAIRRAITDDSVRSAVYQSRADGRRYLAITGVRADLAEAMRREGRTVVTAADAHLYLDHYRDVCGYAPRYLALAAPDGVAVRRCVIRTKHANRAEWIGRGRHPGGLLAQALALATGRVAVVTFQALESWVRGRAPNADVGHYGALRGLDGWKEHDTLITLGDPIPNLDHVARTTDGDISERARALAQAELEQAHGRLRTVHRTTPCTQIHVGSLLPDGWRAPVEEHEPCAGGRPQAPAVDVADLRRMVDALGGVRAAGRVLGVPPITVSRWVRGERVPATEVVAQLAEAARAVAPAGACTGVTETIHIEPSPSLYIDGFGYTTEQTGGTDNAA